MYMNRVEQTWESTFLQSELLFSDFPNNLPPAEFNFAVTVPDLPLVIGIWQVPPNPLLHRKGNFRHLVL